MNNIATPDDESHRSALRRTSTATSEDMSEQVGSIIGPYKLMEQIGQGASEAKYFGELRH